MPPLEVTTVAGSGEQGHLNGLGVATGNWNTRGTCFCAERNTKRAKRNTESEEFNPIAVNPTNEN